MEGLAERSSPTIFAPLFPRPILETVMRIATLRFSIALSLCGLLGLRQPRDCSGQPTQNAASSTSQAMQPDALWSFIGLETAWVRHLATDGMRSHLAAITPYLTGVAPRRVYEVTSPNGTESFAPESLDRWGSALEDAGAKRQADIAQRSLALQGIKAEVKGRDVYRMLLYTQSDAGVLQSVDAETSEVVWTLAVGSQREFPEGLGANEEYVAAVQGSTAYLISLADGKIAAAHALPGVPAGGVVLSRTGLFVPLLGGRLAAYRIDVPHRLPQIRRYTGGLVARPSMSGDQVASLTETGWLYLENIITGQTHHRIEMRSRVAPGLARNRDGTLFVATQDGFVFKIDESKGDVAWQRMVGGTLRQSPFTVENQVFVNAIDGTLFCIDASSGDTLWSSFGIAQIAGITSEHVYGVTRDNRLQTLLRKDGTPAGSADMQSWHILFPNAFSDRIYLASSDGLVRALRPIGKPLPTYFVDPPPPPSDPKKTKVDAPPAKSFSEIPDESEPETTEEPTQPAENDPPPPPAGDNPFGESSPSNADENPFE